MSRKRASLAMYDVGGAATSKLWEGLRRRLLDEGLEEVPEELVVPEDYERLWLDPGLLLGHTCGYPLRHALENRVQYVGTPAYDVPGANGTDYSSAVVVRASDPARSMAALRGRRAAFNKADSQSGYNAFRDLVAPLAGHSRFFSNVVETGGHSASLRAVIEDRADVAAIDAVSLALESAAVRNAVEIIAWTQSVPGLPFITSKATSAGDVARLRRGIAAVFDDADLAETREQLHLSGFEVLPETAYDAVLAMEQRSIALGYPVLA